MSRLDRAVSIARKETTDERGLRNLVRHYFAFLMLKDSSLPYSSIGKSARTGRFFRTIPVRTPKFFKG